MMGLGLGRLNDYDFSLIFWTLGEVGREKKWKSDFYIWLGMCV